MSQAMPPEESVSTSATKTPQRREIELDFIRGIAILMVIDYHSAHTIFLWPFTKLGWTNFGAAGVDIFFVLSGFLVGGLLLKEWKLRGTIDSKRFLVRRGLKIWPQYYIFLLASLLTGHHTLHFLWGNFLNIQNYTGGIAHTWTLALEEQAYLLLTALLAVAAARNFRWHTVFAMVTTLAAFTITRSFWLQYSARIDGYTFTFTRLHGILFGVLLAMLFHFAPESFRRLQRAWPLWITILAVMLLYYRFPKHLWWDPPLKVLLADLSGVSLFMLLYVRRKHHTWFYRCIAWVGLYSYGIYLWHVSVIATTRTLIHHLPAPIQIICDYILPPAAGILIGILMTRLIEFPSLAFRDRLFPRRVDSAAGTPAVEEVS